MRRLPHDRMKPEQVKPGQWYRWHKASWCVEAINVFSTSKGTVGTVHLRQIPSGKSRRVKLSRFVARARRDYGLDGWRAER